MSWQATAWQVWTRGTIMVASAAVIAVAGGQALVREARTESAPPVRPVAMTGPVTPEPAVVTHRAAPTGGFADTIPSPSPPVTSTALRLDLLKGPTGPAGKGRVVLGGLLCETASRQPVVGRVTLWRRARSGDWVTVLSQSTAALDGTVQLTLTQSGPRAVYRLTFAASDRYAAASSAPLTVRRP